VENVGTKRAEKVPAQKDGKERGLAWLPSSRAWYPDTLAAGPYTPTPGPLGPTGPAAYEERWRRRRRRERCMPSLRRDVHRRASERMGPRRGLGRDRAKQRDGGGGGGRGMPVRGPRFFAQGQNRTSPARAPCNTD